jgi:hypothetical protein
MRQVFINRTKFAKIDQMKEMPTIENSMEKIRKEAGEKAREIINKLKTEGLDINLEEEVDTMTVTLKTVDGGMRKIGLMKVLDFPNGKLEEIIEEWAYRSEETDGE